jgi:hypothetical protein
MPMLFAAFGFCFLSTVRVDMRIALVAGHEGACFDTEWQQNEEANGAIDLLKTVM